MTEQSLQLVSRQFLPQGVLDDSSEPPRGCVPADGRHLGRLDQLPVKVHRYFHLSRRDSDWHLLFRPAAWGRPRFGFRAADIQLKRRLHQILQCLFFADREDLGLHGQFLGKVNGPLHFALRCRTLSTFTHTGIRVSCQGNFLEEVYARHSPWSLGETPVWTSGSPCEIKNPERAFRFATVPTESRRATNVRLARSALLSVLVVVLPADSSH